jgi:hypothetical protein
MTARTALWASRVLWLAVGVAGWIAIGAALDGRSTAGAVCAQVVAWMVFGAGVVTLIVPSSAGLTVLRMVAPLAPIAAVLTMFGGAGAGRGASFFGVAVLASVQIATGELGRAFVQSSAYGEEDRFPLRPAAGFLLAVTIGWAVWAAVLTTGAVALCHEVWPLGVVATALALAGAWPLAVRCHRLSRRWLVVVPAGLVVHDHLVLAETLLVQKRALVRVGLALQGTEAADITGPSGGHRVEIVVRDALKIAFAPSRRGTVGRAIHARSFLIAPTRPGQALTAASDRGLPVRS